MNSSRFSVKEIISSLSKCKHLQLLESTYSANVFGPVAGENSKDSDFSLSLECESFEYGKGGGAFATPNPETATGAPV